MSKWNKNGKENFVFLENKFIDDYLFSISSYLADPDLPNGLCFSGLETKIR